MPMNMYIHMSIHMFIFTYVCTRLCPYIQTRVYMGACTCLNMHANAQIYGITSACVGLWHYFGLGTAIDNHYKNDWLLLSTTITVWLF